jgi:hypothetical protein
MPQVASSSVAGKVFADVVPDRVGRQHRAAEVALQGAADIAHELLRQRQVQAQFLAHALHHVLGRPVTDDGQCRVDRDHAADEEGHRQQAEVGQHDDRQQPAGSQAQAQGLAGHHRA